MTSHKFNERTFRDFFEKCHQGQEEDTFLSREQKKDISSLCKTRRGGWANITKKDYIFNFGFH